VHTAYPMNQNVNVYGNSLRVQNNNLQAKDYFMHLVSVMPNSSLPLNVVPMNIENGRIVESNFYGSYHKDVTKDYVILFSSDDLGFNYDSIVYDVPMTNEIIHSYLIGLDTSENYFVSSNLIGGNIRIFVSKQNHLNAAQYTSTSGGILSFELTDYASVSETEIESNNFHVYYNSTEGIIVLNSLSNEAQQNTVSIYTIDGNVLVENISFNFNNLTIATGHLAKGIYVVNIKSKNGDLSNYKIAVY